MADTHLNYIAGTWVPGEHLTENRNPSDISDLIGLYAAGSAGDVDRAATAAAEAQPAWFAAGPQARADLLDRVASAIEARATDIERETAVVDRDAGPRDDPADQRVAVRMRA